MLTLLSWLAVGGVVGLTVRALVPGRQYLGIPRAAALGVCGALLGGLFGAALVGSADAAGDRALTVLLVSAVGAGVAPWMYAAYSVRWEALAAGR